MRDEEILALHRIGSGGLLPDLTFLLEAAPEQVARRLARRDGGESDAIGGRDAGYHGEVAAAFARLAAAEPGRFLRIDGSGAVEATHRLVLDALAPLLEAPE